MDLSGGGIFAPPAAIQTSAHIKSLEEYRSKYAESISNPDRFWRQIAIDNFYWKSIGNEPFCQYNFDIGKGPIYIKWMSGWKTNLCYNALDRQVEMGFGDKLAYIWEGNDPDDHLNVSYKDLLEKVKKFANVLKSKGIGKGDTVAICLPMIVELPISMLACARIGAIHCVIFGGYSPDALATRMIDTKSKLLITADGVWRGTKLIHLKKICHEAVEICKLECHVVDTCIVVQHLGIRNDVKSHETPGIRPFQIEIPFDNSTDCWYHSEMQKSSTDCDCEWLDAEDPLFILYTSGSTGKPKGIVHTQAGYMLYASTTFKFVFDYHSDDIYWCTGDIGWITGHTYVVYGPLLNGATSILFEGVPFHPDCDRYWEIIEKFKVTKFYTAPTAIRSLMKLGNDPVLKHDRKSLKVLGSVGEPINPEAWLWYHNVVGNGNCSIVDTYWQTETGGHVITPLPGCIPTKPGCATFPFFGIEPAILDESGKEVIGAGEGYLVFKRPWPGIMRTVYGDQQRFESNYFAKFPGYYCTSDGCHRDEDGYYWITGRMDDMMNVSGHLLSTAEIESALAGHKSVAEAAVIAKPHGVKGECPHAFVTLKNGFGFDESLIKALKATVRCKIGPVAVPDCIQLAPRLPKTRSGKIMRRILRKIAIGDEDFGDTSTLAEEDVIEELRLTRLL